jgi:predicted PurR-regulated permease PerM
MLKNFVLTCFFLILFSGCGNLSPRNKQNINNPNGDVQNNQQGFLLEVGKLKQEVDIIGSRLKEVQEGLININAALSRNENSGIQILQGDGALFLVFSCVALVFIFYYKNRENEKLLKTVTNKIAEINDENLTNKVIDSVEPAQARKLIKMLR